MIRLTVGQDGLVPLEMAQEGPVALEASEGGGGPMLPHYAGAYEVTPSRAATVLPTEDTILDADVTVHPIPFYQVSNPSGGNTCYIGGAGEIQRS